MIAKKKIETGISKWECTTFVNNLVSFHNCLIDKKKSELLQLCWKID